MDNETTTKVEILLREYEEAGRITRQHEDLTRKSLALFLTGLSGLVTAIYYMSYVRCEPMIVLWLEIAGLVYSLLLLNTVLRSRVWYSSYLKRAKAIETELCMTLYKEGKKRFDESCESAFTIFTNKQAIAGVIGLSAVVFFVAVISRMVALSQNTFLTLGATVIGAIAMYVVFLSCSLAKWRMKRSRSCAPSPQTRRDTHP
jgi:hypothetical protein